MDYFDYNATMPVCEAALSAYHEALREDWRNPSSPYPQAARVRAKLELLREALAERAGRNSPEHIIYTSGATEANHAIFRFLKNIHPDRKILYSAAEHPSVSESAKYFFEKNAIPIPITQAGLVEPETVQDLIKEHQPICVSVMAANNETGIIQPWQKIAHLCRSQAIAFHCDATQSFGKLPIDKAIGDCDFIVGCAHKFGGPKGIGWLGITAQHTGLKILYGGAQENNHRAGTENYPAIAAMHAAWESAEQAVEKHAPALERARDEFEQTLSKAIPGITIVGKQAPRLWNTSMIIMPKLENTRWGSKLAKAGFEVSTGSACAAGKNEPSSVLTAMGYNAKEARQALRVSGDAFRTNADTWRKLADAIISLWQQIHIEPESKSSYGTVIDPD